MLLLVLILVLVAFSLLVAALLSGSVLWAWVSVGVSVAAAVVLLVDYMQRRNAVKAGTEAGTVATPSRAGPPDMAEPATEVLPVIPRPGGAGEAAESSEPGSQPEGATALFDQGADSQQTVVMPVVQPSASADRPSSASPELAPSSGDSSPTVTAAGSGRSDPASRSGEGSGGAQDDQTTAVAQKPPGGQPPADGSADATAMVGTPAADPTAASGATADATAEPAADSTAQPAEGEPPEEPRDPAAAAVVAALDTEVLVIDEQPRYHVTGCRALAGRQLIPIPAREAVDLGFTPCGWCTPDRTLAAQTASR